MIRRRTVLAASLTVPVLARAGATGSAPGAGNEISDLAYLVVAEARISGVTSTMATDTGASILRLGDDLTPIYQLLDRELQGRRFAMAGITSGNAFFVLERLARDRGLKTVHRGNDIHDTLSAWFGGRISDAAAPKPFQAAPSPDGEKLVSWVMVPR